MDKTISKDMEDKLYSKVCKDGVVSSPSKGVLSKLVILDYINEIFSDAVNISSSENVFFDDSELEYILNGKNSSKDNIKSTKRKILVLRAGFNLEYILRTPKLMNFVGEIASSFASVHPIMVPVVKILIVSAISLAEANVDYYNLINSKNVTLRKNDESWNLSIRKLGEVLENQILTNNYNVKEGLSYREYIGVLVYFNKESILVKRLGNLIQLNLKDSDFDYASYYQQIEIEVKVKTYLLYDKIPIVLKIHKKEDLEY